MVYISRNHNVDAINDIFILDLWKEELNKKRSTILSHDNINVNLDMYSLGARLGAVRALKKLDNDFSTQTNLNDIYGSFRKLEVD